MKESEIELSKLEFVKLLKESMYSVLGMAKERVIGIIGTDCHWCNKDFIEKTNECVQKYADDLFNEKLQAKEKKCRCVNASKKKEEIDK